MSRFGRATWHCALLAALFAPMPLCAKTVTVQMLNKGAAGFMVFEPAFVEAQSGDTIVFKATNPGHDVQAIDGMLPSGAATFRGAMGKDYSVVLKAPGLYGVKCNPHLGMGMIGLIRVGAKAPANLDAAKATADRLPGLAKKRMAALLANVK